MLRSARIASAAVAVLASVAVAEPPVVPRPGSAKDDLAHRKAQIDPLLATAQSCVPRRGLLGRNDEDQIELALDAFDNHLVVCTQVLTRRDVSVFFDPVSYACWNVDPATGALARRGDLGRSYFRCQDGGCAPLADATANGYSAGTRVVYDEAKHKLEITDGKPTAIASPAELTDHEPLRGELTYVGQTLFAITDKSVIVLDRAGHELGREPGDEVHVVDDTHVLVFGKSSQQTLHDLSPHKTRKVTVPARLRPVQLAGTLYAIDGARRLAVLDAAFRVKTTRPLATCR